MKKESAHEMPAWARRVVTMAVTLAVVGCIVLVNAYSKPRIDLSRVKSELFDDARIQKGEEYGTYIMRGTVVTATDSTVGIFVRGLSPKMGAFFWVPKTYQACPGESVTIIVRAYKESWWSTGNYPWKVELFNLKK